MTTPNTGIPYVPENTQDPAAGLNLALNVIDALLQTAVIDMGQTAPPGSPNDGDLHIVGTGATGAWAGQDNNLARYVAEGDFWQFYEAGTQVRIVLNLGDGGLYAWTGSTWAPVAGGGSMSWGSITGTLSDQTDLQAALDAKADKAYTVLTEASAFTAAPGTHDGLARLVLAGGDVTFDAAEPYTSGMTFNIRATAAIELIEDGVTLTPPAGGTLELDADMAVQVVFTSATTAVVIGHETMPRGILPSPIVPLSFLQAKADGSGYQAVDDEQMLNALGIPAGKPTADPATPITGSLLSGAMLAAGAIVEQGENANGIYWRWESGLQVCVAQVTSVSTLVWTGTAPAYSEIYEFSWPAVFASDPYMVITSRDYRARSSWGVIQWSDKTQGAVTFATVAPSTSGANPGFTAFAIGFWK